MKIRHIEAGPGERAFGYLEASRTISQIPVHIPLNILRGSHDGPTLLVTGAVHGSEVAGTLGLGQVLRELDLSQLSGTLLAVPVLNTSGFQFDTREIFWDMVNFNLARGTASLDGSPSEQLAWIYLNELVPLADAVVDIHAGKSKYHIWYTIYPGDHPDPDVVQRSQKMAMAFGLKQLARSTPPWGGDADRPPFINVPYITPEVGGGAHFFANGKYQMQACARGITNVMKWMGMLAGDIVTEDDHVEIYDILPTEITAGTQAGIMVLECEWGDELKQGDLYASVYHPFTGERLGEIRAPQDGQVFRGQHIWPVIHAGDWLGIQAQFVGTEKVSF